ncbi:MAG: hypothetical protein KGZ25_10575, partial [Planctomycetes bacterium]|nr:hypothetical protein [Planctomycetota bacterium]
ERDEDIRERFYILDAERIYGGKNKLKLVDIVKKVDFSGVPGDSDWRRGKVVGSAGGSRKSLGFALQDLESEGGVRAAPNQPPDAESYGPLFVRAHNYRIIYGHGGK